jgi:6-phosphogluconolactonase
MTSLTLVPPTWTFENFSDLVDAVSEEVVGRLRSAVAARRQASLVVPGGSTASLVFDGLCGRAAPWADTWVTVSDEYWLAGARIGAHEETVRARLLRGRATSARFVPLQARAADPWGTGGEVDANRAAVPDPLDAVVVGMTEEGGVGALAPGADGLEQALRLASPEIARIVRTGQERACITLSLRALVQARWVAIVIRGEAKMRAYRKALGGDDPLEMPVRALLRQRRCPVHVFWAP